MTPREALYNIIVELGPIPQTLRDDNITFKEARLRDSVRTLQNFIHYHDPNGKTLPESGDDLSFGPKEDFVRPPRQTVRGDGKTRLDTWKKEAGH